FLGQKKEPRNFIAKMVLLHRPRKLLYEKINTRVDQMMADGLAEEVKELIPHKALTPLQTVGYKELFRYYEGACSLEEAVNEIKKNSRRYAKRQITWFKKYENALSFPADAPVTEIYELLKD
ncbi:MAG: tRNA dimethylallyltransferase, partial [Flavobacteriaceae bacterium]